MIEYVGERAEEIGEGSSRAERGDDEATGYFSFEDVVYAYEQANKNGQSPTMPPLKQLTKIKKSLDYLEKWMSM